MEQTSPTGSRWKDQTATITLQLAAIASDWLSSINKSATGLFFVFFPLYKARRPAAAAQSNVLEPILGGGLPKWALAMALSRELDNIVHCTATALGLSLTVAKA